MPHVKCQVVVTVLLLVAGCGSEPEPIAVRGKITLAGRPLADAHVYFAPKGELGSFAAGVTDAEGQYELSQTASASGIQPGSYRVSISTFVEAVPANDPPIARVPERVPAQYNLDSTLTREVFDEPAEQILNFELDAGGRVVQPDQESNG